MSSGVAVNPECQALFQRMAEKKEFRYIIYKVEDKDIIVDVAVTPDEIAPSTDSYDDNSKAVYDHFLTKVKEVTSQYNDCRFAVFDFRFTVSRQGVGNSKMDKIVFLQICPDGASIKKKMVYASSASAMKTALDPGKMVSLQVSDESEMDHREVFNKLSEKFKS